ncbi:MAG: prepilin-type N-terminal cleavage/methylation domain-containing protein [Sulfuricaulis sp.]|nr:prepilin-type N-terminal cleavage/methylation domain-containing protein [Sulfuricaulis sp.]
MNSSRPCAPPHLRAGFTLVEIMIVVVIIGLLAALAVPAFGRVRQSAQNSRFVSDLRTFSQAFESYAALNGTWPANAGSGAIPAGMSGSFNDSNWKGRNSVGGRWNWDRNLNSIAAGVSTTDVTVSDAQMAAADAVIDDGNLATGLFQKINGRFTYILEP